MSVVDRLLAQLRVEATSRGEEWLQEQLAMVLGDGFPGTSSWGQEST